MSRKTFTTTIDESLQQEFKESCKKNGEKMNNVLEALMRAYIDGNLTIQKRVTYHINNANDDVPPDFKLSEDPLKDI